MLLLLLLCFFLGVFSRVTLGIGRHPGFIVDYFVQEQAVTVTTALCDRETNVWLYKRFSERKIKFDSLDLRHLKEKEIERRVTSIYGRQGVLLDLKCPGSRDLLKLTDEKELFTHGNSHWLLLVPTHYSKETLQAMAESYNPQPLDHLRFLEQPYRDHKLEKYMFTINRKVNADFIKFFKKARKEMKKTNKNTPANKTEIDYLLDMNVLQDTKMALAVPEFLPNGTIYALYSFYKNTRETKPLIHEIGRASPEQLNQLKRSRRKNLKGAIIRAASAIYQPENFTTIDDLTTRDIDIWAKASYFQVKDLAEDLGFKIVTRFFGNYGWQTNGTFSHLMGFLQRRKAEFCASCVLMRHDRMRVLEYLTCPFSLESRILFREPSLSSVSNVFVLPFSKGVWISICGATILTLMALRFRIAIASVWLPPDESLSSLEDVVNYIIGAVFQQGFAKNPKSPTARVLIFFALLTSLALFTSYSACIVALMQSSSSAISTVEDLTRSNFEVGVASQFTPLRVYIKEATSPKMKEFYRRKVLPKGESAFVDRREGIERMRTGMFAFEVELYAGYKLISETYNEIEKCRLKEIDVMYYPKVACMTVTRLSPYKELFKVRYQVQQESGMFSRTWKLWTNEKPKCNVERIGFMSVGLQEFSPALQVLGYGVAATLFIFALEILFGRRKDLPNVFRVGKRKPVRRGGRNTFLQ